MTRALTRTHFHSSRLIRILADLASVEAVEPGRAFAEKLGLWVDYTHAIKLCAVHNARPVNPAGTALQTAAAAVATAEEFARARASLERAITVGSLPQPDPSDAALFAPQAGTSLDITAAFEPYRRYYLMQQRDMDLKVGPLRSRVREALAGASAALGQLAALDAALEDILGEREGKLLSALPQLLKKRFAHLLRGQRLMPTSAPAGGQPGPRLQPLNWLAGFGNELQTVLLAELDLRLQPTLGLIEALHHEKTKQP